MKYAHLAAINLETQKYWYDIQSAYDSLEHIDNKVIYDSVYRAIDESLHVLDFDFDEEYGCYYTTAIFGTQFDASTTYSTLLSILPSELCYAYSEDPIVDTYNDQDQYINVFFDADYTVAVECVCYFYSESYGYVAQISVYNFDDYFAS